MMLSLAAVLVLTTAANAEYLHWGVEIVGVAADSSWGFLPAVAAIDESGLVGDLHGAEEVNEEWVANTTGTNHWWSVEFDTAYPLGVAWIWNSRWAEAGTTGFRSTDIYYTPEGGGAEVLLDNFSFFIATGTDPIAHQTEIDFGGVMAEGVRFQQISDWGHPFGAGGLQEVRFNLADESGPCDPVDWNNDGVIDDLDLTELAVHWQQSVPANTQGDADGNGFVDDLDLTALAVCWPTGDLDVSAVPEPATLSLLAAGGLALLRRKRQ